MNTPTIATRFSVCVFCDEPIRIGEHIARERGLGWIHALCATYGAELERIRYRGRADT